MDVLRISFVDSIKRDEVVDGYTVVLIVFGSGRAVVVNTVIK